MYQNILVINTMHIGDLMLVTPALRTLRTNYPKAHITLLTDKPLGDLVRCNENLDECILIDKHGQDKGLFALVRFIRKIRARHFDLVINFHRNERASAIAAFSGGKRIVDVEQIRDYLDEIRQNLPVELRQAQSIVSDRAQLIDSANAQAQAIVKKAEERARILVSEAEIVKAAQQRAGEIVSAAQTEARTVRQTVTDYCDNMLKTTEETMAENAAQVKSVRANLRQSPRKPM